MRSSPFASRTSAATFLSLLSYVSAQSVPGANMYRGAGAPGAGTYQLIDDYSASGFFDKFDFYSDYDPTYGHVQYVNQQTAQQNGYVTTTSSNSARISVDTTKKWPNGGPGRPAVRLISDNTYTHGLFVFDVLHMPWGCGAWPAYWLLGPDWPFNGEIDIIEGVHTSLSNTVSLHTNVGCTIAGSDQTADPQTTNCDKDAQNNAGCGSVLNSTKIPNNYGDDLNKNGGGVYVTEWTNAYIKTWFFARQNIPSSIANGAPDVSQFGRPAVNMQGGCDIDSHFANMSVIINTDFCGAWAGEVYSQYPNCPQSTTGESSLNACVDYVGNNPSAFNDAYWDIASLRVYQMPVGSQPASSYSTSLSSVTGLTATNTIPRGMGAITSSMTSLAYSVPLSSASSTTASRIRQATPSICPQYDQQVWQDYNGNNYNIYCGNDFSGDTFSTFQATSFEGCLERCDTTAGCAALNYVGGNGEGPCYMKKSQGAIKSLSGTYGAIKVNALPADGSQSSGVNGAAPTGVASSPISCPSSNNTVYTNAAGSKYTVYCGVDTQPASFQASAGGDLEECIDQCDSVAGCSVASWAGGNCYFKGAPTSYVNSPDSQIAVKLGSALGQSSASPVFTSYPTSLSATSPSSVAPVSATPTSSGPPRYIPPPCPGISGTQFAPPGDNKTYNIYCEVDSDAPTLSLQYIDSDGDYSSCFAPCEAIVGCTGFTWYDLGGGSGFCYFRAVAGNRYSSGGNILAQLLAPDAPTSIPSAYLTATSSSMVMSSSTPDQYTTSMSSSSASSTTSSTMISSSSSTMSSMSMPDKYSASTKSSASMSLPDQYSASISTSSSMMSSSSSMTMSESIMFSVASLSSLSSSSSSSTTLSLPVPYSGTISTPNMSSSSSMVTSSTTSLPNSMFSSSASPPLYGQTTDPSTATSSPSKMSTPGAYGGSTSSSSTSSSSTSSSPTSSSSMSSSMSMSTPAQYGSSSSSSSMSMSTSSSISVPPMYSASSMSSSLSSSSSLAAYSPATRMGSSSMGSSSSSMMSNTSSSSSTGGPIGYGSTLLSSLGVSTSITPGGPVQYSTPMAISSSTSSSMSMSVSSSGPAIYSPPAVTSNVLPSYGFITPSSSSSSMSYSTSSSSSSSSSPPVSTAPPCPTDQSQYCGSDSQTVCANSGGQSYALQCGVVYQGTEIDTSSIRYSLIKRAIEPNVGACQGLCDQTTGCVALNYNTTTQNCQLLSSVSGYTYAPGAVGGTVVPTASPAPSAIPAPPTCPGSAGKYFTDSKGTGYNLVCYTDYTGVNIGTAYSASSIANCLPDCDANSACVGVVHNAPNGLCQLKSSLAGSQTGNTSLIAALRAGSSPPLYGGAANTTTSPPALSAPSTVTTTLQPAVTSVLSLSSGATITVAASSTGQLVTVVSTVTQTAPSGYFTINTGGSYYVYTTSPTSAATGSPPPASLCYTCALTPVVMTGVTDSTTAPPAGAGPPTTYNPTCAALPAIVGKTTVFTTYTVIDCGPQPTCPSSGYFIYQGSATQPGQQVITSTNSNGSLVSYTQIPANPTTTLTGSPSGVATVYVPGGAASTAIVPVNTGTPVCPQSDMAVYTDSMGMQYRILCGVEFTDAVVDTQTQDSLASCISSCDLFNTLTFYTASKCLGVTYIPGTTSGNCLLRSDHTPRARAGYNSAELLTPYNGPGTNGMVPIGPTGTLSVAETITAIPTGPGTGPGTDLGQDQEPAQVLGTVPAPNQTINTTTLSVSYVPSTIYSISQAASTYTSNGVQFVTSYGVSTAVSVSYVPASTNTVTTTKIQYVPSTVYSIRQVVSTYTSNGVQYLTSYGVSTAVSVSYVLASTNTVYQTFVSTTYVPTTIYSISQVVSTVVVNSVSYVTSYGIATAVSVSYVPASTNTVNQTIISISFSNDITQSVTAPGATVTTGETGGTGGGVVTVTQMPSVPLTTYGPPATVTQTTGPGGYVTVTQSNGPGTGDGTGMQTTTAYVTITVPPASRSSTRSTSVFTCRTYATNYLDGLHGRIKRAGKKSIFDDDVVSEESDRIAPVARPGAAPVVFHRDGPC